MKFKRSTGITLIALVITIIVLLILAGVTLSLALNSNGVFQRSKNAASAYREAEEAERAELERIAGEMDEEMGIFPPVEATTIATNPTKYYGKTVNYSVNGISDWKVLYSNGTNIFLIASDCVEYTKLPLGSIGMSNSETGGNYNLYWKTVPSSQNVSSDLSSTFMWSNWTDYSTFTNGKCISPLLNTNNWTSFVDEDYADYAIGTPTIEMLVASINAKYPNEEALAVNTNGLGYQFIIENNNSDSINLSSDDVSSAVNHAAYGDGSNVDELYFPKTSDTGYWLASPSGELDAKVFVLDLYGNIFGGNYSSPYNGGVRPVVSLKSTTKLVKGTGDYDLNLE